MAEKTFFIYNVSREEQFIVVSDALGRVLLRPEVTEIVSSFGSEAKKTPGLVSIDIVPPIPKQELDKLGEALVQLAKDLDPSDPVPTYDIK